MATALALCAAVVGRFCKRPALTHSLWLLVLLKLVTPPLLPVSCLPSSWWAEPEPAAVVKPSVPVPPAPVIVAQAPFTNLVSEPAPPQRKTNIKEVGDPKAIGQKFKEAAKEAANPAMPPAELPSAP